MTDVEPLIACHSCHALMAKSARFCPNCGNASRSHQREIIRQVDGERAKSARAVWAIACLFAGGVGALILPGGEASYVNWWQDVGMIVVSLVAVFILGWHKLVDCLAGLPSVRHFFAGMGIGLLTLAFSLFYVWLLPSPEFLADGEVIEGPEITLSIVIAVVLLAPIIEEWIDRGVAWQAAGQIGGPRFTIIVTALLFALAHGMNGWFVLEMPHRFVSGLAYGWIRWRSGSLIPAIAAHMTHNGIAVWMDS